MKRAAPFLSRIMLLAVVFSIGWFASASETVSTNDDLEERAIVETAKQMSLPVERVRADHKTGCDGDTSSIYVCLEYRRKLRDLKLNELYSRLQFHLNTESSKSKLKKAQLAWIKYRDASCEYQQDGYHGGASGNIAGLACLEQMTIDRNKILEGYLACDGTGCPGEW